MNILLTNDDGYFAPGINAIKKALEKYGKVYVVAPHTAQSGKSVGLTSFLGLIYHKIDDYNYTVEGTPVDCMQIASMLIKEKIDVIVSGCNNGYNLSFDSMYSGTCGACYQALMFGKKAIAISCEKFQEPTQILDNIDEILEYVFTNNLLSEDYFLNINLPAPEYKKLKGFKITKLYRRHTYYEMNLKSKSKNWWNIVHFHGDITNDDTQDVSAVANGYCSITPLSLSNCLESNYEDLKEKAKCL